MKYFSILIVSIVFMASCSSLKKTVESTITDLYRSQKSLSALSADEMDGRVVGTFGIHLAADYIASELKNAGIPPFFTSYRDSFMLDSIIGYNVVGVIKSDPPSDEYILLTAHYDHIKEKPNKGDEIYNGANDNASGVTTVLEIAKFLNQHKGEIKKNVIIALFSAEEVGLKGSEHLAAKLKKEKLKLSYLVNYEMVGVPLTAGGGKMYLTGYKMSDMYQQLNAAYGKEWVVFEPNEEPYRLFYRSDNYPFYEEFNVPCQTLSTFDFKNYDYYHHVDDEIQFLDLKHMDQMIDINSIALLKLLSENKEIKFIER